MRGRGCPKSSRTRRKQRSVEKPAPVPGAAEHGAAHGAAQGEAHGEDHVQLPEISPIPGVTFVDTIIKLMDYELHGRTLGWRPNDIIIGRFTDNINNYQLGVLEAVRFTTLRLKDSLTRLGEADSYDPDLEQARESFHEQRHLMVVPIGGKFIRPGDRAPEKIQNQT